MYKLECQTRSTSRKHMRQAGEAALVAASRLFSIWEHAALTTEKLIMLNGLSNPPRTLKGNVKND